MNDKRYANACRKTKQLAICLTAIIIVLLLIKPSLFASEQQISKILDNEITNNNDSLKETIIADLYVGTGTEIQITQSNAKIDIITTVQESTNTSYKDIPLSHELQDYTLNLCEDYDLPFELVFAIISIESNFKADVISQTNDYGLMQINKINHSWLKDEYGVTDFLDPRQNIFCGVIMISELYNKYSDVHKALMAYNMGENGAKRYWNKDIFTSKYSRNVVAKMEEYSLSFQHEDIKMNLREHRPKGSYPERN